MSFKQSLVVAVALLSVGSRTSLAGVVSEFASASGNDSSQSLVVKGAGTYLVNFFSESTQNASALNFKINGVSQNQANVSGSGPFSYTRAFSTNEVGATQFEFQTSGGNVAYDFSVMAINPSVTSLSTASGNDSSQSLVVEGAGTYLVNFFSESTQNASALDFKINGVSQNQANVSGSGPFSYTRAFTTNEVGATQFEFQTSGGNVDYDFSVMAIDPSLVSVVTASGNDSSQSLVVEDSGIALVNFFAESTHNVNDLRFEFNNEPRNDVDVSGADPFTYSRASTVPEGVHEFGFRALNTSNGLSYDMQVLVLSESVAEVPEPSSFAVMTIIALVGATFKRNRHVCSAQ